MRRIMLIIIALSVFAFPASAECAVYILAYHSFAGGIASSLDFTLEELSAHLDRIASMGFRFVELEAALAGSFDGDSVVVVTIDDGNYTVFEAFEKVFKPRGIKPFLFLYPNVIGKVKTALSVERLAALAKAGCGIGAHGFYHEYMTSRAWRDDQSKVRKEVEWPGPTLEWMLGARPRLFAYPFGVAGPETAAALAEAGYRWGFTAIDSLAPFSPGDKSIDPFFVPRTIVYRWNVEAIMKGLASRKPAAKRP
jgi:peptidoglycan/xylan/chitin deacetylase (PgdA/CDA1 family)